MSTHTEHITALARELGLLRPRDLAHHKIPRSSLAYAMRRGSVVRVGRGLYALPEKNLSEFCSFAEVARRVPKGVVCLLSALRFHDLTTQAPWEVWLAIESSAAPPKLGYPPIRLIWNNIHVLNYDVEEHVIDGVLVRVTSVAKTITDCFKYRNKIGLDVALEALRDAWGKGAVTSSDLWRCAKVDRVTNVMLPYLEAMQ